MYAISLAVVTALALFLQTHCESQEHEYPKIAQCEIKSNSGKADYPIQGKVIFEQNGPNENTSIEIDLRGFKTDDEYEYHGFHIHSYGNLTNGCKGAGGHYNPMGVSHGGPSDTVRHVGDLGHIQETSNDAIKTKFSDHIISLYGEHSIIGRSVVIHETADDFGRGNNTGSTTTGNAGARLACCIIEEWHPVDPSSATSITSHVFIILSTFVFSLFLCL